MDEWYNGRTINIYNIAPRSVWHGECISCGCYLWRTKLIYSPKVCPGCARKEAKVKHYPRGHNDSGIWVAPCKRCGRDRWMTDSKYCPEFCSDCNKELESDLPEHQ